MFLIKLYWFYLVVSVVLSLHFGAFLLDMLVTKEFSDTWFQLCNVTAVVRFELDAEIQAGCVMSWCGQQREGLKDLPAVSFDVEMFYHESCKPIYFKVKGQGQGHEAQKTGGMGLCSRVSAVFF